MNPDRLRVWGVGFWVLGQGQQAAGLLLLEIPISPTEPATGALFGAPLKDAMAFLTPTWRLTQGELHSLSASEARCHYKALNDSDETVMKLPSCHTAGYRRLSDCAHATATSSDT